MAGESAGEIGNHAARVSPVKLAHVLILTRDLIVSACPACAGFRDALRRGAHRRAAVEELAALDDRTLRDIGLTRAGIHAVVLGPPGNAPERVCRHVRAVLE